MPLTLSSMPEELLERILALALALALVPAPPASTSSPPWHAPPATSPRTRTRAAPLLVSRAWLRIGTPVFYRAVALRSDRQARALAATLRTSPELGRWVRALRVDGTFPALPDVVRACPALEAFDMTVDNGAPAPSQPARSQPTHAAAVDPLLARFCSAFAGMRRLRHLVIRKNAYLTQPGPTMIFDELGKAIRGWKDLETVNIAFRFSPSPASASFAASLAVAPRLRDVSAILPAVWNTTLLEISQNPSLERIHLTPDTELVGAHLFLSEAHKHPRLVELIRAGTAGMRVRSRSGPVFSSAGRGSAPVASYAPITAHAHASSQLHAYTPTQPGRPPAPFQRLAQRERERTKAAQQQQHQQQQAQRGLPMFAAPPQMRGVPVPTVRRMSAV